MTRRTRGFLEGLILEYQKGRAVIAFGTLGPLSKDWEMRMRLGSIDAGKNMATAMRRGLGASIELPVPAASFYGGGHAGPLAPDALEPAREAMRRIVGELRKA